MAGNGAKIGGVAAESRLRFVASKITCASLCGDLDKSGILVSSGIP